ncbi:MAG: phosphatidate cytidylyltransferase [Pseudomonadota bacterium]
MRRTETEEPLPIGKEAASGGRSPVSAKTEKRNDLVIRLLSAAVLIPFALLVVWAGGWPLAVGAAVFAVVMGYEWSAMAQLKHRWRLMSALALANLTVPLVGVLAGFLVLTAAAIALFASAHRKGWIVAFGVAYAGGMPLALQALRMGPWDGQSAALILMGIVWASDSAAYFAGRGFGGPSLSPDSPNKTWSGAVGAVFCCILCGLIAAGLLKGSLAAWMVTGAAISIIAQGGDLLESSIKRRFGVKDASDFVPGHGGVMDRVDGLGAVCVIGGLIFAVSPGLVLFLGL